LLACTGGRSFSAASKSNAFCCRSHCNPSHC
jgi:hypothetical protein